MPLILSGVCSLSSANYCSNPFENFANILGTNDACCHFPFKFKGVTYNECTLAESSQRWCSTQVDAAGNYIGGKWKNCDEKCVDHKAPGILNTGMYGFRSILRCQDASLY